MRPDIKMIHIRTKKSVYKSWMKLYKDKVVENKFYNESIAKIATAYINRGRLVLVLVQQVNHGKALSSMIPGSVFLSGKSTKKKREAGIKNLRNKYISCIVRIGLILDVICFYGDAYIMLNLHEFNLTSIETYTQVRKFIFYTRLFLSRRL